MLLPVIQGHDQLQVTRVLLHVFSLQLPCRRVLYTELVRLLSNDSRKGLKNKRKKRREKDQRGVDNDVLTAERAIEKITDRVTLKNTDQVSSLPFSFPSSSSSSFAPSSSFSISTSSQADCHSQSDLSSQSISMLLQRVDSRLSFFLISPDTSTDISLHLSSSSSSSASSSTSFSGRRDKNVTATCQKEYESITFNSSQKQRQEQRHRQHNNNQTHHKSILFSSSKTISSNRCIETFRTLKDKEHSLPEDFYLLISLSFALGIKSKKCETVSDILHLSKAIVGFDFSLQEKQNSDFNYTISSSNESNKHGEVESRDLGPTGNFLFALLRYAAEGFPLPNIELNSVILRGSNDVIDSTDSAPSNNDNHPDDSSHDKINSGSKSNNINTRNTYCNDNDLKNKDNSIQLISPSNHQLYITHFACCYNMTLGLLRCLILTLVIIKDIRSMNDNDEGNNKNNNNGHENDNEIDRGDDDSIYETSSFENKNINIGSKIFFILMFFLFVFSVCVDHFIRVPIINILFDCTYIILNRVHFIPY